MNFRPPGTEFAKTSYRWEGSRAAVKTCVGNAAISIGWIPAYQKREQMPEGCLHDQWDLDESIPLLLSTGNPSPPEKFSGPADLVRCEFCDTGRTDGGGGGGERVGQVHVVAPAVPFL